MKFGLFSGILWGLDTVVLGIALSMSPYIGTAEAVAFAAIASSFLHDAGCALWLLLYMGAKRRLGDTLAALKTRSGLVVVLGALLGGLEVLGLELLHGLQAVMASGKRIGALAHGAHLPRLAALSLPEAIFSACSWRLSSSAAHSSMKPGL